MPVLPWSAIDTVLLDMDGTLLDLHYDNRFWLEHLPQRYAELHGVSRAMAELELQPLFERNAGTLNWYCLDFWSRELKLPIRELKREIADLIALRPDADTFLAAIRQAGKRVVITAGPTFEDVDPVRFIGNRSSGKMGFAVAQAVAGGQAERGIVLGGSGQGCGAERNRARSRPKVGRRYSLRRCSIAVDDHVLMMFYGAYGKQASRHCRRSGPPRSQCAGGMP